MEGFYSTYVHVFDLRERGNGVNSALAVLMPDIVGLRLYSRLSLIPIVNHEAA